LDVDEMVVGTITELIEELVPKWQTLLDEDVVMVVDEVVPKWQTLLDEVVTGVATIGVVARVVGTTTGVVDVDVTIGMAVVDVVATGAEVSFWPAQI